MLELAIRFLLLFLFLVMKNFENFDLKLFWLQIWSRACLFNFVLSPTLKLFNVVIHCNNKWSFLLFYWVRIINRHFIFWSHNLLSDSCWRIVLLKNHLILLRIILKIWMFRVILVNHKRKDMTLVSQIIVLQYQGLVLRLLWIVVDWIRVAKIVFTFTLTANVSHWVI